jgi:hypothetical protein
MFDKVLGAFTPNGATTVNTFQGAKKRSDEDVERNNGNHAKRAAVSETVPVYNEATATEMAFISQPSTVPFLVNEDPLLYVYDSTAG